MPTQEEINQIIARILGKKSVEADDLLIQHLSAESVDIVNIVATIEERYHIRIPEERLAEFRTPADLFRALSQ